MRLLGLELSDAGIMAAGSEPVRLLELDGGERESPGYALAEKDGLRVGRTAEKKAHLVPRLINSHFWDQLNTKSLDQPGPYARQNHAEIAHAHLARIWETLKEQGDQMIVAVPGFYSRDQLGLLLGIANDLTIPIKGFAPLALAASSSACPGKMLFHLDIHLHRTEIVFLDQAEQLTSKDAVSIAESGLAHLNKEWVETIAAEFVRTTRFDPLYQAGSEQQLYDRLPGVLKQLQSNPAIDFEMTGRAGIFRVMLTRELFIKKSEPVFRHMQRMVQKILDKHAKARSEVVLQTSHRLARLPGCKEILAGLSGVELIELDPGAAAIGALKLGGILAAQNNVGGPIFLTKRPWQTTQKTNARLTSNRLPENRRPTHLLYRNLAYPLSEKPLSIGLEVAPGESGIRIEGQIAGVSRKHCSVQLQAEQAVLTDLSTYGTFVDESRVNASITLKIGQIIRVGTPGEKLQLIACLHHDET